MTWSGMHYLEIYKMGSDNMADELIEMISQFSDEYLNEEYKNLNIKLAHTLMAMPEVSLDRGKPENWACAIIYAVGQLNFLFDSPIKPYITQDFLCGYFNSRRSTITVKARDIRRLLNLKLGDEEFSTEFVLSLNIPESDDDLKRIRQLDEIKFLISQKRPEDVADVENNELLKVIQSCQDGKKDLEEVYFLLKTSYFIGFYSDFSILIHSEEDDKFIIPLFTSADECSALMGTFNVLPRIFPFSSIIQYLGYEKFNGVIINPDADDFFVSREMIGEIYPNPKKIDYFHIFFPR